MSSGPVVERVRELWRGYTAPDFAHVPNSDAALFLCAVDHRTGYEREHVVDGEGPFSGSELLWAVALRRPELLSAAALRDVDASRVAEMFAVDDETVADSDRRAALWRDLARGLERDYDGSAQRLLDSADRSLADLLARLAAFDAYSDPLAKKSQLFAKICARRGWLEVADPEHWEVSADNVLMRLALRSGLVDSGSLDEVRAATRDAFKRVALEAKIPAPELDDMLWELGREDPDLLGVVADVSEPPRDPKSAWY
ncbi:MAG: queuosine salvage family protein [Solirubrobacterales bacterium]